MSPNFIETVKKKVSHWQDQLDSLPELKEGQAVAADRRLLQEYYQRRIDFWSGKLGLESQLKENPNNRIVVTDPEILNYDGN